MQIIKVKHCQGHDLTCPNLMFKSGGGREVLHLFNKHVYSLTGEAAHLAADFDFVCESEYPNCQLAEYIARQHASSDIQEIEGRKSAVLAAK